MESTQWIGFGDRSKPAVLIELGTAGGVEMESAALSGASAILMGTIVVKIGVT